MKDLSYLELADIYGKALTEKQREIISDYYALDYSLTEMAENRGVSRQAVHYALKQAEDSLIDYEANFGFHAFLLELNSKLEDIDGSGSEQIEGKIGEIADFIRSSYGTFRKP